MPNILWWKHRGIIATRSPVGAITSHSVGVLRRALVKCKDGLVISGATIARGRQALREWFASQGLEGELFDKKWEKFFLEGTPPNREQIEYIGDRFQTLASMYTREEFMFEAQKRKIQASKINTISDVMDDPHLKESDYFVKVEHPELNDTITYSGAPFKSKEMSWSYRRRAPFIGEHNREIYTDELGINQQELVILKQGGII